VSHRKALPGRPQIEELEPRILYAADMAALALGPQLLGEVRLLDQPAAQRAPVDLVFVDSRTPQHEERLADWLAERLSLPQVAPARGFEVVRLDAQRGLHEQVAQAMQALQGRHAVGDLHFITPDAAQPAAPLAAAPAPAPRALVPGLAAEPLAAALAAAEPLPAGLPAAGAAPVVAPLVAPLPGPAPQPVAEALAGPVPDAVAAPSGLQTAPVEFVFVDPRVPDVQQLLDDLAAQAVGGAQGPRTLQVVLLDAQQDGVAQIGAALAAQQASGGAGSVAAVHIVSHGSPLGIQVGSSLLSLQGLPQQQAALQAWAGVLGDEADILFYGCEVAATPEGQALLQALAEATGADVAASTDLTGHVSAGGDWELEFHTGAIETAGVVSAQLQSAWGITLALVPVGGEVRVNVDGNNDQNVTDFGGGQIAADANGNFVIVWNDGDSNGGDILFQRYAADGSTVGSPTRVNTTTSNTQTDAAVAMNADGNFVVVWASYAQDSPNTWGVYGQRFDAGGSAVGSEFRVNVGTAGNQYVPKVAMAADGSFVVAFNDLQSYDVRFQRYDSGGAALGGNLIANTYTTNDQWFPDVAMMPDGRFIITWESFGQDGSENGVYGQLFTAAGAKQGGEIQLHSTTAGIQESSKVSYAGDGSFVVAWESERAGTVDFMVRRFSDAGVPLTGEIVANTRLPDEQRWGDVASRADGSFVAVWQSLNQDGSQLGIYAQHFDPLGVKLGGEVRINSSTTNNQRYPSVIYSDSQAVVVWDSNHTGSYDVFLQRLETTPGNAITVTTTSDVWDGNTGSIELLIANPGADGRISLREALTAAGNTLNAGGAPDLIRFDIPDALVGGVHTITLSWDGPDGDSLPDLLPYITDPVIIDASTEPDAVAAGRPIVVIDGSGTLGVPNADGLRLYGGSSGSTVRGLVIQNFAEDGIDISESDGNLIAGNWLGTNAAGTGAAANMHGLNLWDSIGNTIGGVAAADRNVISGNSGSGLYIGGGSQDNRVLGNTIGLSADGSVAVGNMGAGVWIRDGGTLRDGIVVSGNLVGTDGDGLDDAAERNLISGNWIGVLLDGLDVWANTVAGNWIGLDATGLVARGNTEDGVRLQAGAYANTIGGIGAALTNVISASGRDGVRIDDGSTDSNVVQGNWVGLNAAGTGTLGNAGDGIFVRAGADYTLIGGDAPGAGNWVVASGLVGIEVDGGSAGTVIQGNRIGTNAAGTANWGSQQNGILLEGGASGTLVGGTTAAQANVVAFSGQGGAFTSAIQINASAGTGNAVLRNQLLSNAGLGIDLGAQGVLANDLGDADTGPNDLQNYPVLSSAAASAAGTLVQGSLNTEATTAYRIDFYASRPGHGQAERWLGAIAVTTDVSGNVSFNETLAAWVNAGDLVTATATRDLGGGSFGSTSEMAAVVAATANNLLLVDTTADTTDGAATPATPQRWPPAAVRTRASACARRCWPPTAPRAR
jgi:hypothetical protein